MARIEGVEATNRPFTRFAFFMSKRKLGRVITPIKIMAHHPRLLRAYAHMELGQEAAHTVDEQLKALVQVKIAMSIGCPFWVDIGSAVGRQRGLTDEKLKALNDIENSSALCDLEKLGLCYAIAMTETPVVVSDELFDELLNNFSNQQLVELTSCIAWENYRARFDHALGIEAEGFSGVDYCPLPLATSEPRTDMNEWHSTKPRLLRRNIAEKKMVSSIELYATIIAIIVACGCAAADKDAALTVQKHETNKALVWRCYENVVSTGEFAVLAEFISLDYLEIYQRLKLNLPLIYFFWPYGIHG